MVEGVVLTIDNVNEIRNYANRILDICAGEANRITEVETSAPTPAAKKKTKAKKKTAAAPVEASHPELQQEFAKQFTDGGVAGLQERYEKDSFTAAFMPSGVVGDEDLVYYLKWLMTAIPALANYASWKNFNKSARSQISKQLFPAS